MRTVLVTGGGGFVGRHLCALLTARGDRVVATHHPDHPPAAVAGVEWRPWLLTEPPGALLAEVDPDDIYHLASPAHVPTAQAAPEATIEAILTGTHRLLEAVTAVTDARCTRRFLYVGSGEEYGAPSDGQPLTELSPLRPRSIYGVCKLAASHLALSYGAPPGLKVVCVRPFNQVGPGQSAGFAVASFAQQIAAIKRGEAEPVLKVGNVDVERDFIDVEDSVLGHVAALELGGAGEIYNICSGTPTRLAILVEAMIARAGVPISVSVDPARLRANEIPRIFGSAAKLNADTGWQLRSSAAAAAVRAFDVGQPVKQDRHSETGAPT